MKSQYVKDLESNTKINSDFAVISQDPPKTYNKKPGMWFSCIVGDKTGKISIKYWGGPDEDEVKALFDSFTIGDIVSITGQAQFDSYENAIGISIDAKNGNSMQKKDTFDIEDFLPVSKKNIDGMISKLRETIAEIQDPDIKRLTKSFFDDSSFMEKYSKTPAASTRHHNYVGGLIEHVLSMIKLSKVIALQYEGDLNLDLMVAGCIFHDIGKMEELEIKSTITYSTRGKLLGHISIGAQMIQNKVDSLEGFSETTRNKILHLILSHHGTLEFGSPVEPMFPEAIALNKIDECDAKIKHAIQLKQEHMSNDEEFTYIRGFGKMYLR